ncbi:MAG: DUF3368 domain-containing protein [Thermoflexales bacterium]|nr:DUF3368 domain-containing protein [Thermoflexales bacterium]
MNSEKPVIVSNASLLINLARIGHLDLLQAVYNELVIPEAVWEEVVVAGAGQLGAEQVRQADWIRVRPVTNRHLVNALRQDLDAGEAEAITLAAELGADLLLMDERLGRETARHLGLRCMGLIGVLVEAKHRGMIRAIKPYLDMLRDIAGFRIRDDLYQRVLEDEAEL